MVRNMVLFMMILMWTVMTKVVKLTQQKGPEETEGSSEVTGPVQQGEVRGGFFLQVFVLLLLLRRCFLLSSPSPFQQVLMSGFGMNIGHI